MAQTKRKRRTKHRGTPAGNIQTRGRTGRPSTPEEKKKQSQLDARERRLNTPPTWKSSFKRATFAAVIMFAFIALTNKGTVATKIGTGAGFAVIALALYVPAGYYMELFLFRRRQSKRLQGPRK